MKHMSLSLMHRETLKVKKLIGIKSEQLHTAKRKKKKRNHDAGPLSPGHFTDSIQGHSGRLQALFQLQSSFQPCKHVQDICLS